MLADVYVRMQQFHRAIDALARGGEAAESDPHCIYLKALCLV